MVVGPGVNLGTLLLTFVDNLQAGALLEAQRVEARPALNLRLLLFAEGRVTQQFEELAVLRNRQPLPPAAGLFEGFVVEWLARIRFHAPAWLVERADLVGQQRLVIKLRGHIENRSFSFCAAPP